MFALLASLALGGADAGQLSLTNVRTTHGLLGPDRSKDQLLPGDSLFVSFDIEGIKTDSDGRARYSTGLEVTDRQGKVLYAREPHEREATLALGGSHLPAYAHVNIGLDQPPGQYRLKVTVKDVAGGSSQSFTRDVEVLPKAFGLVRLTTTAEHEGQVPCPMIGEGQMVYIQCMAVGFARDANTKQPKVHVAMRILDDAGKPVLPKAVGGEAGAGVAEHGADIPIQFLLPVNRAGKFTVELKATDQVNNKTAALTFPLTVHRLK